MIEWLVPLFRGKNNTYYDKHYMLLDKQPIEVMQEELTPEEFKGFLKGNIIKYKYRAGHKQGESFGKDKTKQARYEYWLFEAEHGRKINPRI